MIAIPTLEEDAKRPGRERDALVGERTRIINRFKSTLAGLGIRGFKPNLRHAAARLETLRTPEGAPLPDNTLAELRREMARLQLIAEQIHAIEAARLKRLEQPPKEGAHPTVRLLAQVRGLGVETADMLANEVFSRPLRDQQAVARYACPGEGRGRAHRIARRERQPPAGKGVARAGNRPPVRSPRVSYCGRRREWPAGDCQNKSGALSLITAGRR